MDTKNTLTVPLAIVVAGLLIAGAIFFSRGGVPSFPKGATGEENAPVPTAAAPMRPVDATDHIKGNPNAELVIVEYSDTECPFCKRFHETMQQVIDEYGKSGKVAWVYRHFPLEQLHAKARSEAEATECAAELGGNTGFWKYLDELFRVTPSNDGLPAAELAGIAGRAGLDRAAFEACRASGRHAKRVQTDYDDAVASGGSGTPWSIIIAKDGKKLPINGAQPYETVKQTIDALLKKI